MDRQISLANKIKREYGIPVANWINNVVDTGVSNHTDWLSRGGDAIDWPITWTHCMPYYKGGGSNTCPELTCEIANSSNSNCCLDQWASSCSKKCYGPEGTCGWGLEKMKRDRAVVGDSANYKVLLQAFEMPSYNNAHLPTADQMYEEACRVAQSGVVDLIVWYDWDKSYGGYSKDLHSGRNDQYGGDRWATMKKIYEECINTTPTTPSPPPGGGPGDADGDGEVDIDDYNILISQYLNYNPSPNNDPDFNIDGYVDGVDFVIWLNNN